MVMAPACARVAVAGAVAALALGVATAAAQTYTVTVSSKGARPAISIANPPGAGYSPCQYTFNPAWLPAGPGLNSSILLMRAALCPDSYGGAIDHLLFAYCDIEGVCGDVQQLQFPFEPQAEDPRVVYDAATGYYLLYYYASGPGQQTVYLRRSRTPLDPSSWELVVGQLPWHRNGCLILRSDGNHYVIFGEVRGAMPQHCGSASADATADARALCALSQTYGPTKGPLPGIGIATTRDFVNYTVVNYTVVNATWMEPYFNDTQVRGRERGAGTAAQHVTMSAPSRVESRTTWCARRLRRGECHGQRRQSPHLPSLAQSQQSQSLPLLPQALLRRP